MADEVQKFFAASQSKMGQAHSIKKHFNRSDNERGSHIVYLAWTSTHHYHFASTLGLLAGY